VHAQRIVGGNETGVNEFPWVAGIVRTGEDKAGKIPYNFSGFFLLFFYTNLALVRSHFGRQSSCPHCGSLHAKVKSRALYKLKLQLVTFSETNKTVEVLLGEHDYTTQEETAELRAKVQRLF
jgi:hypothetical protein